MIRIEHKFSRKLLKEVRCGFVVPTTIARAHSFLQSYVGDDKAIFEDVLSDNNIHRLSFGGVRVLQERIADTYGNIPMLCERYCPEMFFKDLSISEEMADFSLRSSGSRKEMLEYKNTLIVEVSIFMAKENSILLKGVLSDILVANAPSEIRAAVKKALNIKLGKQYKLKYLDDAFPLWVKEFRKIFDYSLLSRLFGYSIVRDINASVCLYCNEEKIPLFDEEEAEYRPDLDHFYPKSKFPFLATSLFNLLPSGDRCNQGYKRDVIPVGVVSPYEGGVSDERFFVFNYDFTDKISVHNLSVDLEGSSLINGNAELFKLSVIYNSIDNKEIFTGIYDRYMYQKSLGKERELLIDPEKVDRFLFVKLFSHPKNDPLKKFKVDSLNDISNSSFGLMKGG